MFLCFPCKINQLFIIKKEVAFKNYFIYPAVLVQFSSRYINMWNMKFFKIYLVIASLFISPKVLLLFSHWATVKKIIKSVQWDHWLVLKLIFPENQWKHSSAQEFKFVCQPALAVTVLVC